MNTIKSFIIFMAAFMMCACTENKGTKSIVLYYSQTGVTEAVAEEISKLTGSRIVAIEVEQPYDGNYEQTIARVQREREMGILPTVKPLNVNLEEYDVIFLGYPIWFGTYAPPVIALLKELTLEGKKVVPFCTFGSGGLEATEKELKVTFPNVDIASGYGVRAARIACMGPEVERFLKEGGYIEGDVEALSPFSEHQVVGETEKTIFDMACGDYMFPLGNPVTFGIRQRDCGTEYQFSVDNGTTIYVLAEMSDNLVKAEFTRVVR